MIRRTVFSVLIAAFSLSTSLFFGSALSTLAYANALSQSAQAVKAINQIRQEIGVSPLRNDERLARACRNHVRWMSMNALLMHGEVKNSPLYTADGDLAGRNAVLIYEHPSVVQASKDTIHWLYNSPIHLQQLLHPSLSRSGYAFFDNYACMISKEIHSDFSYGFIKTAIRHRGRNQVFTYPKHNAKGVALSEHAVNESPNPNTWMRLPAAKATGPFIYVYASGFDGLKTSQRRECAPIKILSATLRDSSRRRVAIRFADDVATHRIQTGSSLRPSSCSNPHGQALLVPVNKLWPSTKYTVSLRLVGAYATKKLSPEPTRSRLLLAARRNFHFIAVFFRGRFE